MKDWSLSDPPIWETALGVVTAESSIFDTYEVSKLHDLFRLQFPRAERQVSLLNIEPFEQQHPIMPQLQLPPFIPTTATRWWFTSEDGRNLLQVQDNFVGRNWRRIGMAPATSQSYCDFGCLVSSFEEAVSRLAEYSVENGRLLPNPRLVNLTYINHFMQTRSDGSVRRIRETAPYLQFSDTIPKSAVATSWLEEVPGGGDGASILMQVTLNFLGLMDVRSDGTIEQKPFARLAFDARGTCAAWSDVRKLADRAHGHMRQRLTDLTTAEMRATWQ